MDMNDNRIAVIGMSFRFPSAENKAAFTAMLRNGEYAKAGTHEARGELVGIADYHELLKNIRTIDGIEYFDNSFFGIVKPEVMEMPPELRLTMQGAAEAIMDAGYSIQSISRRKCGAVTAQTTCSYKRLLKKTSFLSFFNNMPGMTCGYLAQYLKLNGPVYHLDSTCSSTLSAAAAACNHLLMGQADLMLAGGVQICMPVDSQESKDMLSNVLSIGADGQCLPFDKNAAGFFSSEGVGFVLLERYEDAVRNHDHIYGIIRGYGMHSNAGRCATIYAPNADAQYLALKEAWKMAGITADDLTEFEAHGAATVQGDMAEVCCMSRALSERTVKEAVLLSAVKSNLGHSGNAAGITGLIKLLLSFEAKTVFPISGFTEADPKLDLVGAHLAPVKSPIALDRHRIADIGSYGLNELNVHMILESAENIPAPNLKPDKVHYLKCSAASETALSAYLAEIAEEIGRTDDRDDLIHTLNFGRDDFAYRCFIRFENTDDLLLKLTCPVDIVKCKINKAAQAVCPENEDEICRIYLSGGNIDWCALAKKTQYQKLPSVTYPFEKKKIWA
ncbi:Beta-ketoacyl synthase, C-terminal domain [Ruminococcus sp. YE71]|nr:polyketide synthase [Ruminococcus sp. YE78]SDA26092.1 Beta-ketoacyl synthase, C-terminal domain [Ruminococcus sp. YE78]SFW35855.1 Beta-ketoacyl synthase, C-terminal domain [Ruminococcus sp. YE71]